MQASSPPGGGKSSTAWPTAPTASMLPRSAPQQSIAFARAIIVDSVHQRYPMPVMAARTTIMAVPPPRGGGFSAVRTYAPHGWSRRTAPLRPAAANPPCPLASRAYLDRVAWYARTRSTLGREWSQWLIAFAPNVPSRGCRIHGHLKKKLVDHLSPPIRISHATISQKVPYCPRLLSKTQRY